MLRLGIVDFDSSHAVEFTRRINRCAIPADQFVAGAKVVLGFPGTSKLAQDRIDQFTPLVVDCGVELVDEPTEMIGRIDGVLVLSLQGDCHLAAARPFLESRVPVYLDKPIACDVNDLDELIALSQRHETMLWSSSAVRFADDVVSIGSRLKELGNTNGVQVFGPAHFSELNRGLFHYGIHITETMFTLMGTGCERLSTISSPACDLVSGLWRDGRVASIRGHRQGHTAYGVSCFTAQGIVHQPISLASAYRNLCQQIVTAFETETPPVSLAETREIIQFLAAAETSRQQDGVPISLN